MKTQFIRLAVLCACLPLAACNKHDQPAATLTAPPPFAGARKTSFQEVTSQLDPGGSLFAYLAVDQWLAGLSTNLSQVREVLLSMPGPAAENRDQIEHAFDLVSRLVKNSGVEDVTGVGLSGAQVAPELYRNKFILHHPEGAGKGFAWSMFGRAPHALSGLDLLPANTAIAGFGDLDVTQLWQILERELAQSGVPEAAEWARAWPAQFEQQTQLSWPKLLASLGGELGLVLTLDESRKIVLPTGRNTIDLPAPALLVAVKVKDDLLYDRISRELTNNPQTTVTSEGGLKMCAMPLPIPLPLPLQIVVATSGDYFFFATSADLVRTAMQVRQGKQPGLKKSAEFQNLAKHLPAEGNQFFYVSPTFGETIATIQKQAMRDSGLPAEQVTRLQRFFTGGTMAYSLSVGAHTSTGWHSTSVGNQDSAKAVMLVPIAVTAVGAGMLLPALAKAKSRAQAISSVNQLKQIGLAARIYATDHQDKYPPAETWCEALKDSLGGNVSVYKAPSDPSSGRCSYAYNAKLSGRDEGRVNPQTVMFFETAGGWNQHGGRELMITTPRNSGVFVVGFADGSVQQISPARLGSLRWDP